MTDFTMSEPARPPSPIRRAPRERVKRGWPQRHRGHGAEKMRQGEGAEGGAERRGLATETRRTRSGADGSG